MQTVRNAGVRGRPSAAPAETPEVSIVMPCLNEAATLGACIQEALLTLEQGGISGEVVVADNGSTDGSVEIARLMGARVVTVPQVGYGNALRAGIGHSRGRYVIMGDSDGSYQFRDVPRFLELLREGFELVMGNRFAGGIAPGAMPWLHRYLGNPALSWIGRVLFRSPVGDFQCGLRGFRRDAYDRMALSAGGMEFASEIVVKAALLRLRVAEVPVFLQRDGRPGRSHLRSWRDGWRNLRLMVRLRAAIGEAVR